MSIISARTSAIPTDDYLEFCTFLQIRCGIDLRQYKRQQMERRLRSFYAQRGVTDLRDAIERLRTDKPHLDELLDRITINVSQLWRNPEQWDLLAKIVLPELATRGRVDIWSAGSSYGAEAYTLAAICVGLSGQFSIRGTDIDKRMVARARQGLFSADDARSAPSDGLRRAFDKVDGGYQAKPALKAITRFDVGDLLKGSPATASFDLILCRNTVIYFNEPIRDELHARLAKALRPGGYLMVGSTERVSDAASLGLTMAHPFIYRKS